MNFSCVLFALQGFICCGQTQPANVSLLSGRIYQGLQSCSDPSTQQWGAVTFLVGHAVLRVHAKWRPPCRMISHVQCVEHTILFYKMAASTCVQGPDRITPGIQPVLGHAMQTMHALTASHWFSGNVKCKCLVLLFSGLFGNCILESMRGTWHSTAVYCLRLYPARCSIWAAHSHPCIEVKKVSSGSMSPILERHRVN